MNKTNIRRADTERLAILALLTGLVAILSYLGGFIKLGSLASINLTLIPVVLGAAYVGPLAGAWLGAVSGIIFFLTPDSAYWMGLSAHGTVITVMLKGILAGLCAGLVYKLLENKNRYLAVFAASIVCPIVNTGIFLLGCLTFFMDAVNSGAAANEMSVFGFMIVFYVGLNFVFELIVNVVLNPVITKVLNVVKKN